MSFVLKISSVNGIHIKLFEILSERYIKELMLRSEQLSSLSIYEGRNL